MNKGGGCLNYNFAEAFRKNSAMIFTQINGKILERICLPHISAIAKHLQIEETELKDRLGYFRKEGTSSLNGKKLSEIAEWFGIRTEVFSYLGTEPKPVPTKQELEKMGLDPETYSHITGDNENETNITGQHQAKYQVMDSIS